MPDNDSETEDVQMEDGPASAPEDPNWEFAATTRPSALRRIRKRGRSALEGAFDRALDVQTTAVEGHVRWMRNRTGTGSDEKVLAALGREYLSAITASGATVGGTAAVPGIGTGAAIGLGVGEVGVFLEATVFYVLCVAHVHGVQPADLERRRALVLAVMMGNSGAAVVQKAAGRTGAHWGRLFTSAMPMEGIRSINKVLGRNFVTKYGTRQGIVVIGRLAPFGVGAAIGAGGNALLGQTMINRARRAFGDPVASTG